MPSELSYVLQSLNVREDFLSFHPMSITMNGYHMMAMVHILDKEFFLAKDPVIVKVEGDNNVRYLKPFGFSDDRIILYKRKDAVSMVQLAERWIDHYGKFVRDLYEGSEEEIEPFGGDEEEESKPVQAPKRSLH